MMTFSPAFWDNVGELGSAAAASEGIVGGLLYSFMILLGGLSSLVPVFLVVSFSTSFHLKTLLSTSSPQICLPSPWDWV
jgi:hypothetical protein